MFPKTEIEGFHKYWRRRKPSASTAIHYSSYVTIFFNWAKERSPDDITVHDVDRFIEWQQCLGRAPATITRRLVALRMFYDYLAYAGDEEATIPVVPHRHYVCRSHRLPRDLSDEVIQGLFAAIGEHLRDCTIFTLMLHAGLRVGEVVKLHLADVDPGAFCTPRLRLNGKSQQERFVYLSATAA